MKTSNSKKNWVRFVIVALLTAGALAAPSNVRADERGGRDGFLEIAIGQASPQGDKQWDNSYGSTGKFGIRGGSMPSRGLGFEVALDYTPLDSTHTNLLIGNLDTSWDRMRLLVGGRAGTVLAHHLELFGRFLIGADYIRGSYDLNVGGNTSSDSTDDTGLALELGGGVNFRLLDTFTVGAQIDLPLAFHFTDQDVGNQQYFDYKYNAYDLDILLVAGLTF